MTKRLYVPLKVNQRYEVLNEYPYYIRQVETHKTPFSYYDLDGLIYVELDEKVYPLHLLIAHQFIPNPNNYKNAIMKSIDVRDIHLNNIFWSNVSPSKKLQEKQQKTTNKFLFEVFKSDEEYHKVLNEVRTSLRSFDFIGDGTINERQELIKQLRAKFEPYCDKYFKYRYTILGKPDIKYSAELGYKVIEQHDKLMTELFKPHKEHHNNLFNESSTTIKTIKQLKEADIEEVPRHLYKLKKKLDEEERNNIDIDEL